MVIGGTTEPGASQVLLSAAKPLVVPDTVFHHLQESFSALSVNGAELVAEQVDSPGDSVDPLCEGK